MIQKTASEKMIDLDAEEVVFAVKIMVAHFFEIDSSGIHMAVALMSQNITVQLHIDVLASEIRCLGTVVFILVLRLVDVVTKEQQPWILYHKFGKFVNAIHILVFKINIIRWSQDELH